MSTQSSVEIRAAGLLFDMDGTVVDSQESILDTWTTYAQSRSLDIDTVLALLPGRTATDIVELCRPELGPQGVADDVGWIREREAACGVPVHAIPGAAQLLTSLDLPHWAVVTAASRAMMTTRLTSAGLPLPAMSVCAEDVTAGKPSPEGFLLAAELLGVDPATCVVFEDSTAGLLAGQSAGALCIGLGGADGPADIRVRDLTAITARVTDTGVALEVQQ